MHWPDEKEFPESADSYYYYIDNYIRNSEYIYPSFFVRLIGLTEHGLNKEIYINSQKVEKDMDIGISLQNKIAERIKKYTHKDDILLIIC